MTCFIRIVLEVPGMTLLLFVLIYIGLRDMLRLFISFCWTVACLHFRILLSEFFVQPGPRLFGPIGFWFHSCQLEGISGVIFLFLKAVSCLSVFWSCLEEGLLRQLQKIVIIKVVWKYEFFPWTLSLNDLNQSLHFLPQFLHLGYKNVTKYKDGIIIGHAFSIGLGKSSSRSF